MNTPLNTILNWFQTGDFPTEAQFTASWSSFRHKDDAIPADQISGLSTLFQQTASIGAFNTHLTDSNAHTGYLAKLDATNLTATNVDEWRNKLGVGQLSQNVASVDDADHVGNVYTKNQSNDLFMANADFVNDDGKILAEKIESGFVRKLQGDFKALINTSEAAPDATFTRFVTLKPDGTPGIKNLSDIAGTDTLQNIVDRGNSTTKSIVFNPAQGRAGELNFNAVTQSYHFGNMNSAHTGELNSSYGYNALSKVSSGSENTAYGSYTGANLSTGKENTFFGTYAGENATTGNYNTMVGAESGNSTTTGYKNSFFGTFAGFHNTAGAYNTVMGYAAGNNSVLNDKNTLIGAYAGTGISGYNNVMIGVGSGLNNGNISNKLIIHNNHTHYNYSNTSEGNYTTPQHGQLNRALITGDFVDRWVRFNAGYFQVGNPGDNNNDITINPATGITSAVQYTPQTNRDYIQRGWVFQNYYNMTQVDSMISRVYKPKGSIANYDALIALTNQQVGDVWNLLDTGDNYVWVEDTDGNNTPGWDRLSGWVPQGLFDVLEQNSIASISSPFYIESTNNGGINSGLISVNGNNAEFTVINNGDVISLTLGDSGIRIYDDFLRRGLVAGQDYSQNIQDLDYTQKIYVDSNFIKQNFDQIEVNPDGGNIHKTPGSSNALDLNLNLSDDEGFVFAADSANSQSFFTISPSSFGINVKDKISNHTSSVYFDKDRGMTAIDDYLDPQGLDYIQKIYADYTYLKMVGTENSQYYNSEFQFDKGSGSGGGYGGIKLMTSTTDDHLDFPSYSTQIFMNVEEGINLRKSEAGGDVHSNLTVTTYGMNLYIQSNPSNANRYEFSANGIYTAYYIPPTTDAHFVQKKYVDDKKPYKSYTCLLATTGSPTPSPSFNVNENGIGNILWTRTGVGEFTGRLNGAFPADKFVCFSQLSLDNGGSGSMKTIIAGRTDNNNIFVKIKNANDGTPYEPNGKFGFLEIRVYN
ncbi:hypothetical protein [uncultured Chryseobacterium sp.]|uniref:hypothetical protein n=1 Tax=uncultured Chryseobacterium sp. TaxID=259322 RepID=UPI0025FC00C3|nr:hypothetical protein [uncultured Chryseobacterium sp.]